MSKDIDITSLAVELNTAEKVPEAPETKVEEKSETKVEAKPKETLESLESLAEKTEDAIPLKKYMSEKNARREAEAKAKELESELTKLRSLPKDTVQVTANVKQLAETYNIDENALNAILDASYKMSKDKIKSELESEINPKLAEFEEMKKEKQINEFDNKLNTVLSETLKEMPEYTDLIDKADIKQWVKSGEYSKLTLPQLIETKYGKFVKGKKTAEKTYTASRENETPDVNNMSSEDYSRLDKDPELRKKWAEGLPNRLKGIL